MKAPMVTLLSDFGLKDSYVAEMKAVVLSICPDARVVDITHEIRKFDVRMGAYVLARAAQYFPNGTIHIAVVDPEVGTERRPIMVETKRSFYVGPDNGLLMLSALREGIRHTYEIANPKYTLKNVSKTFHGRDIFSPATAHLANGVSPTCFGPEVDDLVVPEYAKPQLKGKKALAEVVHVDGFGNIITNMSLDDLRKIGIKEGEKFQVKIRDAMLSLRFCSAYSDVPLGEPLALIGSSNFLEIARNQEDVARTYNVKIGDPVQLTL